MKNSMSVQIILSVLMITQVLSSQKTTKVYELDTRIVGGETVTKRQDLPYQASVRFRWRHICGGSIISSKTILTAAHCCFYESGTKRPTEYFTIVVGDLDLIKSDLTVERQVVNVKSHQDFIQSTYENDVAIMTLDKTLTPWTEFVNKIDLAETPPKENTTCHASGWGALTDPGGLADHLQIVHVPIMPQKQCFEFYKDAIKTGMFCAGYAEGKKDSCQGDSGGPLVCDGVQYGIISWGEGCAEKENPGVYTDVAYYRNWILQREGRSGVRSFVNRQIETSYAVLIAIYLIYF